MSYAEVHVLDRKALDNRPVNLIRSVRLVFGQNSPSDVYVNNVHRTKATMNS